AGSVGTAHPLYRPWCRVAGAPPGRRQRRSCLHLHSPVVGRHDWDSALAAGTRGEVGGVGPPATRPSGALWGVSSAAQPPARNRHPPTAPTGDRRGGGATCHPVLAVGQTAGPRLWAGDAHLSVLPPGLSAHHGRHHPGVGDYAYPAASPAGVCPTADCLSP